MSRSQTIETLKSEKFHLVVIGGGATGAGIALDGATRGLKVALIEKDDFAAGTSSRSTKLIHGGVRYLEQAVKRLDKDQYHLVKEALHERATLIKLAPHLSHPIALVTPLYSWWGVPYYRAGLKMYDWLAGRKNLSPSRFLNAKAARKNFPMLKTQGLVGGILYYDGQFDDARMNVSIALTAREQGAVVLNHTEVISLIKENKRLTGLKVREELSGEEFEIHGEVIINATGPFTDKIRKLEDPDCKPMLKASSGIHIVLDKRFSPSETGLLIPKTEDGRVLFLLPWLGHTLVGTTDNPAQVQENPKPAEEDIQYILRHLTQYFDIPVTRQDVLSSWSGLRPLIADPKAADTAKLSRDHVIHVGPAGLMSIAGGKWTTYRKMAKDAVDHAIEIGQLTAQGPSLTEQTPIDGAKGFSEELTPELIFRYGLEPDVAQHLAHSYGGHAFQIAQLAEQGYGERLAAPHPYLAAEVVYGIRREMALSVIDILARRIRLTFLDAAAARRALPRVLELLSQELGWTPMQRNLEEQKFFYYLDHIPMAETASAEKKTA